VNPTAARLTLKPANYSPQLLEKYMTNNPTIEAVAELVKLYFDRMSTTDKNFIMAAIKRVERKLLLAGLQPAGKIKE
jgi:hypothetical protein